MRLLTTINRDRVIKYWGDNEGQLLQYRGEIINKLPGDICWYLAKIEESDINKICVISSDDWAAITFKTFLLKNVDRFTTACDAYTTSISRDIERNLAFLYSRDKKMSPKRKKLILVGETIVNGPFVIIEGNRRAAALFIAKFLVGRIICLGISKKIKEYHWARYTMYAPWPKKK